MLVVLVGQTELGLPSVRGSMGTQPWSRCAP